MALRTEPASISLSKRRTATACITHEGRFRVKPLIFQGRWWFPQTPNDAETGTLTFDQIIGARLSVIGRLKPLNTQPVEPDEQHSAIHGVTTYGTPVTLLKTFAIRTNIALISGISTETWYANYIAIGAHFSSAEELLFNRSWVRFDGIARWLAYEPFAETHDFTSKSTELTVRKPQRSNLGEIPDAIIYNDSHISSGRDGDERWTSTSEAMIAVDAKEPKSLNWHFEAASKLRSLAELLYGRPLQLRMLKVELPREPKKDGYPPYVEVDIHAQIIGGDDSLPPVDRPPMLTAPALLEAAPNAIADWFAQYDTLSAALHLLSTVAADRRMFLNVRFLLAAQAVETFHREACPGTIVSNKEHKAIVDVLTAAIPKGTGKEMRDKLKSLLNFSNEPSLRQRLRSLIALAKDGRDNVMPAYDKAFISAVVDTRNHETHHGKPPHNLLSGGEMHLAVRRIVVLLTVLFLRRLGLTPKAIDAVIAGHLEFNKLWTSRDTT